MRICLIYILFVLYIRLGDQGDIIPVTILELSQLSSVGESTASSVGSATTASKDITRCYTFY